MKSVSIYIQDAQQTPIKTKIKRRSAPMLFEQLDYSKSIKQPEKYPHPEEQDEKGCRFFTENQKTVEQLFFKAKMDNLKFYIQRTVQKERKQRLFRHKPAE